MKWSPLPEVTIKKGSRAPADGVLIPEQNYRNYRTLEDIQPELNKILTGNDLALCEEPSAWQNPLLWGFIGVALGGVAIAVVKK